MSSASAPNRIIHLDRLPAELLQAICDLVQTSDQPVSTTVSRALHPFLLRGLAVHIRVATSYHHLVQVRRAAEKQRDLLSATRSFHCLVTFDFLEEREALPWILARLTSVETLKYRPDGDLAIDLKEMFPTLPHPEKLQSLIWGPTHDVLNDLEWLYTTVPNLTSLTLSGPFFTFSRSFIACITLLPIRVVTIGAAAHVDWRTLTAFVRSPCPMCQLRHIVCNHLKASIGASADEVRESDLEKFFDADFEPDYDALLPGWTLPEWRDQFERSRFREFIDAAAQEGLEVSGTTVEALKVEDAWAAESFWLEERVEDLRDELGANPSEYDEEDYQEMLDIWLEAAKP
ncbi:hypothetical protein JCM10212_000710 [Sporobolomyces blumeae]